MENLKEIIFGVLVGLVFGLMIINCMEKEDQLVETHCKGLTGYEYGKCIMNIY